MKHEPQGDARALGNLLRRGVEVSLFEDQDQGVDDGGARTLAASVAAIDRLLRVERLPLAECSHGGSRVDST